MTVDCLFPACLNLEVPLIWFTISDDSDLVGHQSTRESDTGQILTLRRDSSMADRRALSLSFFKKPCGNSKGGQTDEKQREEEEVSA